MKHAIQGTIAMLAIAVSTIILTIVIMTLAIPKLLSPRGRFRNGLTHALSSVGELWIDINNRVLRFYRGTKWNILLPDKLDPSGSYLVFCNHQSWVDILVLQFCLNRRAPFMRFMLKQQLIWVPFIGLAWWALDFPFLRRYSRQDLLRNPQLRNRDLENAARACEKLKHVPVSMMSFPEGTRFSKEKKLHQHSPYEHLLRPRYGGVGQVLSSFGDTLREVIDVTIHYPDGVPSFWQLVSGQVRRISVYAVLRPIDSGLQVHDLRSDPAAKAGLKGWVDAIWAEKDRSLDLAEASGSLGLAPTVL